MRYDDVVTAFAIHDSGKSRSSPTPLSGTARRQFGLPEARDAAVDGEPLAMLFLDPPRHTRIRAVFNKAFIPKTLNALRPRIQGDRRRATRRKQTPQQMWMRFAIWPCRYRSR